ncbi:ubiquitin-like-specific protease 1D isoform X2 [Prosopis cineraria]|uniref:ubiquitin-like-specific protease 1D isoform X2 n=1 Tax=Prosopis cineraria TaxID=364024 RepID=UPI00240EC57C|nr:ubiquitin-like-specific protease 1D isoform X2 [Prosopis cineraria]
MEHDDGNKVPLQLDWDQLLPERDDEPPPTLIVKPSFSDSLSTPSKLTASGLDQQSLVADNLERLSDRDLTDLLQRKKRTLETAGPKLPDKGEKLRALIKQYEDELARRKRRRLDKEVDVNEKARPATSSSAVERAEIDGLKVKLDSNKEPDDLMSSGKWLKGGSIGFRQENESSKAEPPSAFASCFNNKLEDIDCQKTNAFSRELSHFKHCDNHKMIHNEDFLLKKRKRDQSSSRQLPFQCPSNISRSKTPSDDKSHRAASSFSLQKIGEKLSGCLPKLKDAFKAIRSDGSRSRKDQLIVLDDEDKLYNLEEIDEDEKPAECLKEARIFYPSSDDPESVEICCTDMDCLAPGGYLTSTIMNFYIRYLQQQASLTNRSVTDYLFLNTYFYKKLQDAVSYEQSDRETFFVKFRRWWKGVNIFQKAYVLIPIHEDLHWSLVIICIPDKEDESGPIILHLDSLALHSSISVFHNVRRYLIEEWRYLDQESSCSDIPIADGIWKKLDSKIEERIITVPQQKNDYDCGLFVLYFIKRFIEEAPKRLKKKDLAMFGRQWFQPEEASALRVRIRALLKIEFHKARKHPVVTIHDS